MALTAQVTLSQRSYTAGATPVPTFVIVVANANAVPVVVTGLEFSYTDAFNATVKPAGNVNVPPIGQGQTTTVPALGSITIGPMAIAVGSVANANMFQAVPPSAAPTNPEALALPTSYELWVGALVYGSDGSVNIAGKDRLLVSPTSQPPLGYQGGFAQFNGVNNVVLTAALVG